MDVLVLGPSGKIVDMEPEITWKTNFSQTALATATLRLDNQNNPQGYVENSYFVDQSTPRRLLRKFPVNLRSLPNKTNLISFVCIKAADNYWYPKQYTIVSASRSSSQPPVITVVCSEEVTDLISFGYAFILVSGSQSSYFNGVYRINAVQNNNKAFSYTMSYGPTSNQSVSASASQGVVVKPSSISYTSYKPREFWLDLLNENKGTYFSTGSGSLVLLDCSSNFTFNATSVSPHNLRKGDTVLLRSSLQNFSHLAEVTEIISDTQFGGFIRGYVDPQDLGQDQGGSFYDMGSEDFYQQENIDIDTRPSCMSIYSEGDRYVPSGHIVLVKDSLFAGTKWGHIVYDAVTPPGTSVVVEARASDSLTEVKNAVFTNMNIPSGSVLDITGRYLALKISLYTNNPLATPVFQSLNVAYQIFEGAQEDRNREYTITDFSLNTEGIHYIENTAPFFYENSNCAALSLDKTVSKYSPSGNMLIFQDSGSTCDWSGFNINAEIPPTDASDKPKISIKYKFYNSPDESSTTPWSPPHIFDSNSNDLSVVFPVSGPGSDVFKDKRFGEFYIELFSGKSNEITPVIKSVMLNYKKAYEPGLAYFYTSTISLDGPADSIIITGRLEAIDKTGVEYGITNKINFVSFDLDFEKIPENVLYKIKNNSSNDVIIGVKLYTNNRNERCILKGFAFQIATENGKVKRLNYNDF